MEFPYVALLFSSLFSHRSQKTDFYTWIFKEKKTYITEGKKKLYISTSF